MRRNIAFSESTSWVCAITIGALITGCTDGGAGRDDTPPPSIKQLQSAVAEQEVANRKFVDQLEARLSSKADQTSVQDMDRQLKRSLERDLRGTDAKLGEIRCGANLCKVEIGGVAVADAAAVIAALAIAHTCEMTLVEVPETATENTISAYVDCEAVQQ